MHPKTRPLAPVRSASREGGGELPRHRQPLVLQRYREHSA